jgi:hypothetical protein
LALLIGTVVFATAFCLTGIFPVCDLIAGAFKLGCINKCFQQVDRLVVKILPVILEDADIESQDFRCQVLDNYPEQNQEPDVVNDLVQVRLPGNMIPANKLVAACYLPSS